MAARTASPPTSAARVDAARSPAAASSHSSTAFRRSRATWLSAQAAAVGFGSFATSAASARSPPLRSSFASRVRSATNSSSGTV